MKQVEHPTLAELLNRHHLNAPHVAQAARIQLVVVRAMVARVPVSPPAVAGQVLDGLNRLAGTQYTLDQVDVYLDLAQKTPGGAKETKEVAAWLRDFQQRTS